MIQSRSVISPEHGPTVQRSWERLRFAWDSDMAARCLERQSAYGLHAQLITQSSSQSWLRTAFYNHGAPSRRPRTTAGMCSHQKCGSAPRVVLSQLARCRPHSLEKYTHMSNSRSVGTLTRPSSLPPSYSWKHGPRDSRPSGVARDSVLAPPPSVFSSCTSPHVARVSPPGLRDHRIFVM